MVRRLLPALAAFALVIVGVGGGLLLLTARDRGALEPSTPARPAATQSGPLGLPVGNVVVDYGSRRDRDAIDAAAARLGAADSPETRAAGQALVSHAVKGLDGIVARSSASTLALPSADDPRLEQFILSHLGEAAP